MNGRLFVLLVYDRPYPMEPLKVALRDLSVETCCVRTCEELRRLLPQTQPDLIFTDTSLPDGSWVDVLSFVEKAESPADVIVVGIDKDMRHVSALERGAFDFVLPPFERQALDFIVQSARHDMLRRRQAQERTAVV
jgi:DNA-binding NtrC family response regulator